MNNDKSELNNDFHRDKQSNHKLLDTDKYWRYFIFNTDKKEPFLDPKKIKLYRMFALEIRDF